MSFSVVYDSVKGLLELHCSSNTKYTVKGKGTHDTNLVP